MAIALERTHGEIVDFRNGPKRDQRHCIIAEKSPHTWGALTNTADLEERVWARPYELTHSRIKRKQLLRPANTFERVAPERN
jgi:hypothetical protein